jgi:hypothetical protein
MSFATQKCDGISKRFPPPTCEQHCPPKTMVTMKPFFEKMEGTQNFMQDSVGLFLLT